MTAEQALEAADLAAFFMHDDREAGPYGPGETARVTAAANRALSASDVSLGTREALAANGHWMVYNVTRRANGTEYWSQWDAQHSDDCPCDVDDRPDW